MRKALVSSVALASILLALAGACTPVRATTYTLGLPLGTTGSYSANTNKENITSTALVVVWTNATGLTAAYTVHYENATQETEFYTWDVRYGPGGNSTLAGMWFMVVAANLTVGDNLLMYGSSGTINSSTTMVVAGASRTVNVWQLGQVVFIYWDGPTGLMVKMNMYFGPSDGWFNLTLTATTAWTGLPAIPGYPFEAIGMALAIAVCTGLVYRRRHPQHASPS